MSQQTCVILLGPPGAGKGTQAEFLVDKRKYIHISSGELFRSHLDQETELGKKAAVYINNGNLVPDELTIRMVQERIREIDHDQDFILDGFPRTVGQAKALDSFLETYNPDLREIVIYFSITYSELIERLTGRLTCRAQGHIFHRKNDPPQVEGVCDHDGSELYQREDDRLETVEKRVDVYIEKTKPLVSYYRDQGKLAEVDAEQDIAEVSRAIGTLLDEK